MLPATRPFWLNCDLHTGRISLMLFVLAIVLTGASWLEAQVRYDTDRPPPLRLAGGRRQSAAERPQIAERIQEAARAFEEQHGSGARVLFRPGSAHPVALMGFRAESPAVAPPHVDTSSPGTTDDLRRDGGASQGQGHRLGLAAAAHALSFLRTEGWWLGLDTSIDSVSLVDTHAVRTLEIVRFEQRHRDVPVIAGAGLTVLVDRQGAIRGVVNALRPGLSVDPTPAVTRSRALVTALEALGVAPAARAGILPSRQSRLAIAPLRDGARLVWDLWLRVPDGPFRVLVDAHTGVPLGQGSLLKTLDCQPKPSGLLYAESPAMGPVELLELDDLACSKTQLDGIFIRTFSWTGEDSVTFDPLFSFQIRGTSTESGIVFRANSEKALAQTTVFYHANRIHAFFNDLGFDTLDRPFPSVANMARCYGLDPCANAFYDPLYSYSTGIGIILFGVTPGANFGLEADVVGHEYTHAVVQETVALGDDFFDDDWFFSAALNEGFADYFSSTMVGNPVLGEYTGPAFDLPYIRTLDNDFKWPDDIDSFSYHDTGQIFSGALWDIRQALSADGTDEEGLRRADSLAFATLVSLASNSDFLEAASALLTAANAMELSTAERVTVQDLLAVRGLSFRGNQPPMVIQRLDSGEEATGSVAAATGGGFRLGSTQYQIVVPEMTGKLTVELEANGNVDLYLRFGSPLATPSDATVKSNGPASSESIELRTTTSPPVAPGSWFAIVTNRSENISNYTIRATLEEAAFARVEPLEVGRPLSGEIPGGPALAPVQYKFPIFDPDHQRVRVLVEGSVDVDLHLRHTEPIELDRTGQVSRVIADASARSEGSAEMLEIAQLTVPRLLSGEYYVAVYNNTADSTDYTVRLEVDEVVPEPVNEVMLLERSRTAGNVPAGTGDVVRLDASQYLVEVPDIGWKLTATLRSTGDLALYLRQGSPVAFEKGKLVYDTLADLPLNGDETLTVDIFSPPELEPGTVYLAVGNKDSAPADYTIEFELETDRAVGSLLPLAHGEWTGHLAQGRGNSPLPRLSDFQYQVNIAPDSPGLDVITDPSLAGNVDLYVRRGRPVQLIGDDVVADYRAETERGAEAITIFQEDLEPGSYFVGLLNRETHDVPLNLAAVYEGQLPLTVPVEEGDLFQGTMGPAPAPPTGCLMTFDQFVVEVPANAFELEVHVVPLDGIPLDVLMRRGSRILIDLQQAVVDESFGTVDGPIILSGEDLQPGRHYFALSNCVGVERSYQFFVKVRVPGVPEEILLDGFPARGTVSPPRDGTDGHLHTTQYRLAVQPGDAELVISGWGGPCGLEDVDLLVALNDRVTLEPDGMTNASWVSAGRGPGAETLVINANSQPPLAVGDVVIAIVNRESAPVSFTVGAVTLGTPSVPIQAGTPVLGTVDTTGVDGLGLLSDTQLRLDVATGIEALAVTLAPTLRPGLDIDLHARHGIPVIVRADGLPFSDVSSEEIGSGEEDVILPASGDCLIPGPYFLGVSNFAPEPVEYRLQTALGGSACVPVDLETVIPGTAAASTDGFPTPPPLQLCLRPPAGSAGFQVDIESGAPGGESLDLHVRRGQPVGFAGDVVRDTFGTIGAGGLASVSVPRSGIGPGRYYVALANRAAVEQPYTLWIRPLDETARPLSQGEAASTVVAPASADGLGWLSSEQFTLDVAPDTEQILIEVQTTRPGSRVDLHIRKASRVEVAGHLVLDDIFASGADTGARALLEAPEAGRYFIALRNYRARSEPVQVSVSPGDIRLVRGDVNEDTEINITDSIVLLEHLFLGGPAPCFESADVDANDALEITDPINLLRHEFLGERAPEPPYPDCGTVPGARLDNCSGNGCP